MPLWTDHRRAVSIVGFNSRARCSLHEFCPRLQFAFGHGEPPELIRAFHPEERAIIRGASHPTRLGGSSSAQRDRQGRHCEGAEVCLAVVSWAAIEAAPG